MRLRTLSLKAFGPFTDHVLDFREVAAPGLHVIHGPNEAGKSTALRALLGLLFGIPRKTQDAHTHPMRELSVGACLEAPGGKLLDVVRLKRDKDSLRDLEGRPIDEAVIGRLLGGLDCDGFQALFGFDHERLKRGGEALVEGRGAAGEMLYEAALGGHGVTRVIEQLKKQADGLFSQNSRAQKPEINRILAEYRALAREQRDALVSCQKWWQQAEQTEQTRRDLERLERERRECRLEEQRLHTLKALIAPYARRAARRQELAELGESPRLPARCRERREAAERELEQSAREIARLELDIPRRHEQLSRLSVSEQLLALPLAAAAWLSDSVGAERKAAQDLPALEAQARTLENEVRALLGRIGRSGDSEDIGTLRLTDAHVAAIQAAIRERYDLEKKLALAEERLSASSGELEELRGRLGASPAAQDPEPLQARLRGLDRGLEQRLAEAVELREREQRELEAALRRAPGLPAAASSLLEIELPAEDQLDQVEAAAREQQHSAKARGAELAECERSLALVRRDRRRLSLLGDVPSEAQLGELRQRRDRAWLLVKRAWQNADDVSVEAAELDRERTLPAAFEHLLSGADELGDRLRRETSRVSELSRLTADEEHLTAEQARLLERLGSEQARAAELEARAAALWTERGLVAPAPKDRRSWLRLARDAQRLARSLDDVTNAASRLGAEREQARALLAVALADFGVDGAGSTLAASIEAADARVHELRQLRQEQSKLEQRSAELELRRTRAEQEKKTRSADLAAWTERWATLIEPLGLSAQARPEEAVAALDVFAELSKRQAALVEKRRRVRAIEHDASRFRERVAELVVAHLPDAAGRAADEAAEELTRRFQEARLRVDQRQQLQAEIAHLEDQLARARAAGELAGADLAQLLEQAGLSSSAELERAEQRSERAGQILRELGEVEDEIVELLGGASLNDVERELAAWDRGRLQARLFELEAEDRRLEEECAVTRDRLGGQQRALEEYGGTGAELAQELASRAARLRDAVDQYARARIGLSVLEREIERYRQQNQGPILARANQIFPRLTLGRYRSIGVGVEERTLRCIRDDGVEVELSGLSEGTSYQLYFALRLASIERHLDRLTPLPLVLDDVLIHFDDERSAAALALLGELAEKSQVLLFTHHSRIVDLARQAVPARLLGVHALSRRSQTWREGSDTLSSTSAVSSVSRVRVARSPSEITPTKRLP